MNWIIKDGIIKDVDGDGIRIEDPKGGVLISGMTISGAKGCGIVIGGGSQQNQTTELPVEKLLDLVESRISELPETSQERAYELVSLVRKDPTTFNTKRSLKLLYELAVGVSGSTIATMLQKLIGY